VIFTAAIEGNTVIGYWFCCAEKVVSLRKELQQEEYLSKNIKLSK